MSPDTYVGRDPVTGRALRISVDDGHIADVGLLDTPDEVPWITHSLVDLQINGFAGVDLNAADVTVSDIRQIVHELVWRGTGVWVPTIITESHEHIRRCLEVLARARQEDPLVAAAISSAHLEGPFISPKDGPRGAHDANHVRPPDVDEVECWREIFPIGYLTLSPHWPDSPAAVSAIRRMGIHVAIGHTHAEPADVAHASAAGATLSTHLGNGVMAELPRHPNLVWEQVADPTLSAGLIADGHHLPLAVIETIVRAKGVDNTFLVSDSVTLAGSEPGNYTSPVGGEVVLSESGRLSLAHDDRLLAGSAVCLADCVRHLATSSSLRLGDIVRMATDVPGRLHGQFTNSATTGQLLPGAPAHLVLWDDDFNAITVVNPVVGELT